MVADAILLIIPKDHATKVMRQMFQNDVTPIPKNADVTSAAKRALLNYWSLLLTHTHTAVKLE
jgi:flagellar motor switch protein FliG